MRQGGRKLHIEGLLALLLTLVLASCVVCVLLTGARVYQRLSENSRASYDSRTLTGYLTTRVRQGDVRGGISVEPFGEGDSLCFREELESGDYVTRIYCLDGWLYELYCREEDGLEPGDGEPVLPLEGLELSLSDGLLEITAREGEQSRELRLWLRGEEGTG